MLDNIKNGFGTVVNKIKGADLGRIGRYVAGGAAFIGTSALALVAAKKTDEHVEGETPVEAQVEPVDPDILAEPSVQKADANPTKGKKAK